MAVPRFEVWSDWECNSGVMQEVLRDVEEAEEREEIVGEKGKILYRNLDLVIPREDEAYNALQERKIIRIVDTPVREYRIFKLTESHSGPKRGAIECLGPEYDLKYSKIVRRTEANGLSQPHFEIYGRPPTEHIDVILGAFSPFTSGAPSYFSRGTVEFTDLMDMIYDWDTPLSALEELAEIYGAEILVSRNGATDFEINMLTQIGSTGDQPLFTIGRNILSIEHESDSEEQANVVFVQGGGAEGERGNIAANGFIATTVAGNDITFDEAVVHEDDQWNSFYIREPDGSITAISDSAAPSTITVPGHGVAVGDVVTFVENASGDDLIYVESPSSIATYGETSKVLNRQDVPNINNLGWNGFFNDWTQGGFGPSPCFPNFVPDFEVPEGPVGGSSNCIRRTFTGADSRSSFDTTDGENLGPAWLHRVISTGAVNNPSGLAYVNSSLGSSFLAPDFGYFKRSAGAAVSTDVSGPAIDLFSLSAEGAIETDVQLGSGCETAALLMKWQGQNNHYRAELRWSGGTIRARIRKVVGGTEAAVGSEWNSGGGSCTTTYKIKFVVEDGLQELYVDGTLRASGTDSALTGSGFGGLWSVGLQGSDGPFFQGPVSISEGANEIVITGLTQNWTVEACGLTPVAADANGTAVLPMGAEQECSSLIVRDDVAALQDTFTSTTPITAGDRYVWSCDDANPGVSPDLNRTQSGHLLSESFPPVSGCWQAGLLDLGGTFQTSPSNGSFTSKPQDEFHRSFERCYGRDQLLLQVKVRSVGDALAEPGLGKIDTVAGGSAPLEIDGYLAYISDAAGGTFHLAEVSQTAPETQPIRTNLDTDTFTFAADTDYIIQLFCGNGVQEARLWNAAGTSLLATCSATDGSHFTTDHKGTIVHVSSSGANSSKFTAYHSDKGKDIVVTNLPSGHKAKVLNVSGTVVASATESSGTATIDMLGATTAQLTNNWRAVIVTTAADVEIARYQGVIHPGDSYDLGS